MAPFLSQHFENKMLLKLNNNFSKVNPSEIIEKKNLEEMRLKL